MRGIFELSGSPRPRHRFRGGRDLQGRPERVDLRGDRFRSCSSVFSSGPGVPGRTATHREVLRPHWATGRRPFSRRSIRRRSRPGRFRRESTPARPHARTTARVGIPPPAPDGPLRAPCHCSSLVFRVVRRPPLCGEPARQPPGIRVRPPPRPDRPRRTVGPLADSHFLLTPHWSLSHAFHHEQRFHEDRRLHAHRAAGRHLHHRPADRHPAAGLGCCPPDRPPDAEQHPAARHPPGHVHLRPVQQNRRPQRLLPRIRRSR